MIVVLEVTLFENKMVVKGLQNFFLNLTINIYLQTHKVYKDNAKLVVDISAFIKPTVSLLVIYICTY